MLYFPTKTLHYYRTVIRSLIAAKVAEPIPTHQQYLRCAKKWDIEIARAADRLALFSSFIATPWRGNEIPARSGDFEVTGSSREVLLVVHIEGYSYTPWGLHNHCHHPQIVYRAED
jgi:hypothetical protein